MLLLLLVLAAFYIVDATWLWKNCSFAVLRGGTIPDFTRCDSRSGCLPVPFATPVVLHGRPLYGICVCMHVDHDVQQCLCMRCQRGGECAGAVFGPFPWARLARMPVAVGFALQCVSCIDTQ